MPTSTPHGPRPEWRSRPQTRPQAPPVRPRRTADTLEPFGHQRAVGSHDRYDVRHRAEHRQVREVAPCVRMSEDLSHRLYERQSHAGAGDLGSPVAKLRIGDRHPRRQPAARLVVVGHHCVDAVSSEHRDLNRVGDPAVDGHDEVGPHRHKALYRRRGEAVALAEAVRHRGLDHAAHRAQAQCSGRRRGDAIQVEVAEDHDALARTHGLGHTRRRPGHPGDVVRPHPVTLEGRLEEAPNRFGGIDTPCEQHGRGHLREAAGDRKR